MIRISLQYQLIFTVISTYMQYIQHPSTMKQDLWLILSLLSSWLTQILAASLQHLLPYPPPPYPRFAPPYPQDSPYQGSLLQQYSGVSQHLPAGCHITEIIISRHHYVEQNEYDDDDDDNDDNNSDLQSNLYYLYEYECVNIINLTTGEPLHTINVEHDRVKSIKFENSTISLMPVGVFAEFPNLSKLYINNSSVSSIHPGAFTGLIKLQKLYFQDNNITTISKGIFNSLPNLLILDLSNNQIESIEEHAFLGLFSLQIINLTNNKLKELVPKMFNGLHYLYEIGLSHNLLSVIPVNLFTDLLHSNVFIGLTDNNFNKIDFSVFTKTVYNLTLKNNHINCINNWSHLQNIVDLDLSNNTLKNINELHETLEYINLSENLIEIVNNSLFIRSKTLSIINLSHNLIKHLTENTFQGLIHLRNLHLQNNQITNIPIGFFKDLESLNLLNLSSNKITEFEYGTFSGLSNLTILDISDNKLAYLYDSSFYDLNNLEILNMKDNFITSFDPYELTDHCKHLKIADLNNNLWVCKSLLNIVKILEKQNVSIVKGSTKTANIRGIICLNNNLYNTNHAFIPNFENNTKNGSIAKLYAISSEMDAIKKFFNNDFLHSSFYKYFENFKKINYTLNFNDSRSKAFFKYFDVGFKNTMFYKYFETDLASSSFFERFNAASQKLSTALNSLDADFKNSTFYNFINSDLIGKNISKYFDNGFESSGFYKYFSKEFLNSEFFKYFDKTLQMRIDSNLLKIRNYFNYDFKNSSFSKFFGEEHSNFINNTNLNANVARLIDNTPEINTYDIVGKISKLTDVIKSQEDAMQSARSGTTIFMTFVIIILLGITCLLAINNLRTRFHRNVCKSVSDNNESQMHIADAEMEMM